MSVSDLMSFITFITPYSVRIVNSRSVVGSNLSVVSSVGKYELINVHLIFRFCGKHAEMEFCKYLENELKFVKWFFVPEGHS